MCRKGRGQFHAAHAKVWTRTFHLLTHFTTPYFNLCNMVPHSHACLLIAALNPNPLFFISFPFIPIHTIYNLFPFFFSHPFLSFSLNYFLSYCLLSRFSMLLENRVVGEQYMRRAARRSSGVLQSR